MKEPTYMLGVGDQGSERLELLNTLCNEDSLQFLKKAGLKPGMSVLDLGCGTGIFTSELAKAVGSEGRVVGVDISSEQLTIARTKVKNYPQVKLKELSARDIEQLNEKFDLIYCRFLLMHLIEPDKVVASLVRCLKPGGVIACEESAGMSQGFFSVPSSEIFERWQQLRWMQYQIQGTDTSIGCKLPRIFKQMGLEVTQVQLRQLVLRNPDEKRILGLSIIEIGDTLIQRGMITPIEFTRLLKDLETFCKNDSIFVGFFRYSQVSASIKS